MPGPPPPPTLPSPRQGQPARPKIATANKEMSSLGLLSLSAGAHFFQLWFKLRNTNVFLVSAGCQHFCRACSGGATGGALDSVGKTSRNNSVSFFFFLAWNQGKFSVCIWLWLQGQEVRAGIQPVPARPPGVPLCPHLHSQHTAFPGQPPRWGHSSIPSPFCPVSRELA